VPNVPVGIGVRDPWLADLLVLDDRGAVDVLEVMIDDGLERGPRRDSWRRLGARWPLIAHGTELGIGDAAGPDPTYVARVAAALADLHVHWYSEHLSFLRAASIDLGHFAPLSDDDASRATLAANAAKVREAVGCPLLLENPADVLGWEASGPAAAATLGRAFARALEAARCGALLDLTNLLYGARNDGYDAADFLDALEWDRVVEVHLAGGHLHDGLWIDAHDHPVDDEALELLGEVARRASRLRAVIIERDDRLPGLGALLDEVARVRARLS
jgi:uncharacterized protein